jgi:coenzyme F420-reducing hydrogenase gamma subunit
LNPLLRKLLNTKGLGGCGQCEVRLLEMLSSNIKSTRQRMEMVHSSRFVSRDAIAAFAVVSTTGSRKNRQIEEEVGAAWHG